MSHLTPAFDGTALAAPAPAATRRIVDDYEAWVTEVWDAFVEFADRRIPFTVDQVAREKSLPDPPRPQSQWGSLPRRLVDAGIIRHHGYGGSERAHHSLVHVWIGVPPAMREMVAARIRDERAAARAARIEQRKVAA